MSDFEEHVWIAAPPAAVWALVTDLARTPEWRTTVRSVEPPDVLEVGARFDATTRVLGRTWRWKLVVTAVEPNRRFAYTVAEGLADLDVEYRLTRSGGGCRFVLRAVARPSGLARLVEPLAARQLRNEARSHLAGLKGMVEGASPS